MKIQRSRYFLGGIGVLLLLLVGILWAVAAVASPSGQTPGTIALDETHVRSDCAAGAADDCTLKVTVADADLSMTTDVGPDEDRTVQITIDSAGISAARFTTLVVDIDGGEAFTAQDAVKKGTVQVAPDMDSVLPIVGDVSIDYDESTGIGSSDDPDVEVTRVRVQGGKQLVDLKLNSGLDGGDIIALSYNTSDEEGTVASVRGDEGTMYLNLQEKLGGSESAFGDQGKYSGTFEVAKDVTIDIGNIQGEQHQVRAGLQTGRQFTENLSVGDADIADNGTVTVTVSNPTLRDGPDDDEDLNEDDIEILRGEVEDPVVVNAEEGTISFTATDDIDANTTIRISYYGDDHFDIDLEHGPARADLTDSNIAVPQPGSFSDLYKWRGATRDTITLSVEANTPSNGAVLAVSYAGTERIDYTGTGIDGAAGGSFTVELVDKPDNSVPSAITILDADGMPVSSSDLTAAAAGDGETPVEVTFTVPASGASIEVGQTFYIHFNSMSLAAAFNPRNALDAEHADRPILKIDPSPAGEARAIYDDVSGGDASAVSTVENSGPAVSDSSPANGSSFAPDKAPTLSVAINDVPAPPLGAGVDEDEVMFYVVTDGTELPDGELPSAHLYTGDVSTDEAGTVTASLPLIDDPDKRTDSLNIKDGDVQDVSWWVIVKDDVGNETRSDAKPDDDDDETTDDVGNQPFTLAIDTSAPQSDSENTVTGQYYDAEDEEIKGNRRNSIRLAFDDDINPDSADTDDFTVTVGDTTIAVASVSVQGSDIYLTLAEDLSSDATPTVTIEATDDRITNAAGNALATGDIEVGDAIDPGVNVDLSMGLSTGDLNAVVSTDEDIISVPSVTLYDGDGNRIRAVGSAKRTSATVNEWTFPISINKGPDGADGANAATDGVYNVVVSALDKARNRGTTGNEDASEDNAVTFQIDTQLDAFQVTDDNDFDTLSSGDLVGESDIYYFGLKWNDDEEYAGDSYEDVTLTTAVLNSGDEDNEMDLTAGIDPTGPATSFTITAEGIPQGDHTLTVSGVDEAGNEMENVEIDFTITELSFEFQLRRGVNHISLPRNPSNMDINAVFGSTSEITSVFTFEDGTDMSLAAFRDPASNEFVGSLTTIDASHAYGVESTGSVKISIAIPNVSGGVAPPTVEVKQGWNFVPVTTLDDINIINDQPVMDADAYLGFGWSSGWTFSNNRWTSIAPDPRNDNFDLCTSALESGEVTIGKGYWVYYEGASSLNPGSLPSKPDCS
ncbi:MAG: Ig-like domain-containing protein [Dehalococcoidia bacterium]|nr:Ig-like domain-containing protein [Dehalococcoidia bacterium]